MATSPPFPQGRVRPQGTLSTAQISIQAELKAANGPPIFARAASTDRLNKVTTAPRPQPWLLGPLPSPPNRHRKRKMRLCTSNSTSNGTSTTAAAAAASTRLDSGSSSQKIPTRFPQNHQLRPYACLSPASPLPPHPAKTPQSAAPSLPRTLFFWPLLLECVESLVHAIAFFFFCLDLLDSKTRTGITQTHEFRRTLLAKNAYRSPTGSSSPDQSSPPATTTETTLEHLAHALLGNSPFTR